MENYNLNQAINFSKDVIFVSIPKCGTNTVRKQLKEFNTNKPVVHNYHLNIQQIKELFYLKELKDNLSMNENFPSSGILNNTEIKNKANNKFNKMFKFSLVRNPWARVVSLYFRREGLQLSEKMSFIEFCEKIKYASDTCKQPSLHKNQLGTWFYKWGQNESSLDFKLDNAGSGGESIEISEDGGFIIGTSGNIIIKTDQDLNF